MTATVPKFESIIDLSEVDGSALPKTSPIRGADFEHWRTKARNYLSKFSWVKEIRREFVGYVEPEILAVFVFEIIPNSNNVDTWIWVVVGDLPSAYIPCYDISTPSQALQGYMYEMQRWSDAVLNNQPIDDCYPIEVEPDIELAKMLNARVSFISKNILDKVPS